MALGRRRARRGTSRRIGRNKRYRQVENNPAAVVGQLSGPETPERHHRGKITEWDVLAMHCKPGRALLVGCRREIGTFFSLYQSHQFPAQIAVTKVRVASNKTPVFDRVSRPSLPLTLVFIER